LIHRTVSELEGAAQLASPKIGRITDLRRLFMTRACVTAMVLTTASLLIGIGFPVLAEAEVTKLEITSKQSYGTFRPGEFEFWEGRIFGELRPTEKIPDIEKAPRNADGLVEYSAKISLTFPRNEYSTPK
jgi:hypothetical protein